MNSQSSAFEFKNQVEFYKICIFFIILTFSIYVNSKTAFDVLIAFSSQDQTGQNHCSGKNNLYHILCCIFSKTNEIRKQKFIVIFNEEITGLQATSYKGLVFNATFNNISAISWRSVLLSGETGVSGENHRNSLFLL